MRYRALSADGDYTFGQGSANFLVNSPECVAQKVLTRLQLWRGEWFLDNTEGTPYMQQILGTGTKAIYDLAIQQRVQATDGVTKILKYSSSLVDRSLNVSMSIATVFGETPVETVL